MHFINNVLTKRNISLASELAFVKSNSESIVGFTAWAAGAFDTTYVLTLTPNSDGSDQPLWTAAGMSYHLLISAKFYLISKFLVKPNLP